MYTIVLSELRGLFYDKISQNKGIRMALFFTVVILLFSITKQVMLTQSPLSFYIEICRNEDTNVLNY